MSGQAMTEPMTAETAHGASDPLALGASDRDWVARTLDNLSVEDRIAQLFVLSNREDTADEVAGLSRHRPGGIHRFPTHDLARTWQATRDLLDAAEVPLILSGDIEGGTVSYPFATPIPNQMGIAACDDMELSEALAEIVARESRALGYNWSFTPVVDINRCFRNVVVGTRSYGSSVETILAQARAYVRVLQAHGVAATAKHWPGDGIDDRDQHVVTTVNPLSMADWEESFGRIYRTLIGDGIMAVMSAHIALPAFVRSLFPDAGREAFQPASVSRLINQSLLRERLGFRGIIISDATVMGGLTSWMDREEAVPALIENGCDVFLFSRDAGSDMALMLKGLREGRLSEARLDEAARRMLSLKAKLGLHRLSAEERLGSLDDVRERLRQPTSLAVAEHAAGQSLTLVKDTQSLLPLDPVKHRRVAVLCNEGASFFSGAPDRSFEHFAEEMSLRGFLLRRYDADHMPTVADTDLVIYLLGQEATPGLGSIFLDFAKLHGGARKAMAQFNRELPTLLISFGQPYYLHDAPNFSTYVNGYCSLPANQRELVRRLVGEARFTGRSPVDPFCGMEQLQW
jgi:beta-N-acetylhexosaminidase